MDKRLKISISSPPLDDGPGVPLLSQNRQFQWFTRPTYIYPVVPAYAATMLHRDGFHVLWDDGVAQGKSFEGWLKDLKRFRPHVVAIETKTPVVKRHWEIIKRLKRGEDGFSPTVVLMGDHVSALPEESMQNSPVDFVLTGGDYDFLLLNLMRFLAGKTERLEEGIWYRDNGNILNTGRFRPDHDLRGLPLIDRDLTRWDLYSRHNGNFRRVPGTYTMAGRDCWWSRCSFCSWTSIYPHYRIREPESLVEEIKDLVERYGVREIMDDTGTFPCGDWLRRFCNMMIDSGLNRKVTLDCNMRFGALMEKDYRLMKKAGFRLLLFGIESANDSTLRRLRKGIDTETMLGSLRKARCAGLYPHITIMFGYPWESFEEAMNTVRLGRMLLKKGLAWTVQATVVIPYPGTHLYDYCKDNDLLSTEDWDDFDMRRPVLKTPFPAEGVMKLVRSMYSTAFSPEFLLRRLYMIRDPDDLRYFLRAAAKVIGHIVDFRSGGTERAAH